MKTFVYVYNTALLVLGISKEDFKGFLKPLQAFQGGFFGACVVIGGFTNFLVDPYYEPLLWFILSTLLFSGHAKH